ncbi:MAG: hypothetical protein ACRYGK_15480 [Janthinobacterium lividum]
MSVGLVAAGVGLVGSVISSGAQSSAIDSASQAKTDANNQSIANSQAQFASIQKLLSPYVQAGSGTPTSSFDQAGYNAAMTNYQNQLSQWNGQGGVAKTASAGGHWDGNSTNPGDNTWIPDAAAPGAASNGLTAAPVAPTQAQFTSQTGAMQGGSLQAQQDMLGLNGNAAQQASIDGIQNSAQFNALAQQGENGILQNASATGGLRGGNAQAALGQYRPALLQSLIDQQYSRLSGLSTMGQNAAAGVGTAGLATTGAVNTALSSNGTTAANAALAQGQVTSGLANGAASSIGQLAGSGALSKLFGGTSAPTYNTGGYTGSEFSTGL